MSVEPLDDTDGRGEDRFAELDTSEGTIIYDRANHRAWLQSDDAVTVTDRR